MLGRPMMLWRACQHEWRFPGPTVVMGIVNVTPDSFSDGGRYLDPTAAIAHGHDLVKQGAGIRDTGGESARPGATPVPADEERRRVLPIIERLAREVAVPISIDTYKPGVAAAALEAGASIVNDIGSNRRDPEMWRLIASTGAGYIAMDMKGKPAKLHR